MDVVYATPKISAFIEKLDDTLISRTLETIDLLEEYGHALRMPFSKPVGHGIFELRLPGKHALRILYTFKANKAYLLNIFMKKSEKIPQQETDYALSVKKSLA